ncbi:hypothetical protein BJY01DRAFT_149762 [Aspergillus pseudoustus]|uniref:Uncharacterized protein n=1 Tax=Aspergillus pseudoustus TaxID=1810923 RepID=A0ABR4KAJ4_9EURO
MQPKYRYSPVRVGSQPTQQRSYHALLYITGLHLAAITIRCTRAEFVLQTARKLVGSTHKAGLGLLLTACGILLGLFGIYSFILS